MTTAKTADNHGAIIRQSGRIRTEPRRCQSPDIALRNSSSPTGWEREAPAVFRRQRRSSIPKEPWSPVLPATHRAKASEGFPKAPIQAAIRPHIPTEADIERPQIAAARPRQATASADSNPLPPASVLRLPEEAVPPLRGIVSPAQSSHCANTRKPPAQSGE